MRFADMPQIEGAPGRFMLNQMVAVAELEAGLISARTKAALAAAKVRRKAEGKPGLGATGAPSFQRRPARLLGPFARRRLRPARPTSPRPSPACAPQGSRPQPASPRLLRNRASRLRAGRPLDDDTGSAGACPPRLDPARPFRGAATPEAPWPLITTTLKAREALAKAKRASDPEDRIRAIEAAIEALPMPFPRSIAARKPPSARTLVGSEARPWLTAFASTTPPPFYPMVGGVAASNAAAYTGVLGRYPILHDLGPGGPDGGVVGRRVQGHGQPG